MPGKRSIEKFQVSPVPKPGMLGRLIGWVPKEAIFVEIRNILATTPFQDVQAADIAAVLAKAKLRPRDVVTELLGIYEQAAHLLAADHEVSEADRQSLLALQHAFALTDSEARTATEQVVANLFRQAMREALADDTYTDDERNRLQTLSGSLGMSEAQTRVLYGEAATEAVQNCFRAAIEDRRYTSDEEQRVQTLAQSLGVKLTYDEETARGIARFRFLARVEAGELPSIPVDIILQSGEICHFMAHSLVHKEMRTVTKRVNYSGPTVSFNLAKGIRWRVGSVSVERVSQDVLTHLDTVDFYITSKRLFFRGEKRNTTIRLPQVAHFTAYNDGLRIERQTGRDVFVIGKSANWELAGACLDSAIAAMK